MQIKSEKDGSVEVVLLGKECETLKRAKGLAEQLARFSDDDKLVKWAESARDSLTEILSLAKVMPLKPRKAAV